MKLISIVGARPQFVKLAPLIRAIEARKEVAGLEHLIVHTGQHYDVGLSDIFFQELEIPNPDFNLGIGSGLHGVQTGLMLNKIEQVLIEVVPNMVVVFGDTNSTLAGALAASKLHIAVAHVEAGLRSFNRSMPEEINRIVADHVSDLLLAPTVTAKENLEQERLGNRSVLTGDIMYEAVLLSRRIARSASSVLDRLMLSPGAYGLVTVHRAENTEDPARLASILNALNELASSDLPLIFPLHPRTADRISKCCSDWTAHARLRLIEPLGYFDMLQLLDNARVTLTDSGGLQKEAFFVGCPCVTLREKTEWNETVEGGGNMLVGADREKLFYSVERWKRQYPAGRANFSRSVRQYFGNKSAATAILKAISDFLQKSNSASSTTHDEGVCGDADN
ncbi:MAG: UDP-N-acetylglucosamine 2-epimerase (non-hydrolyzing) [Gammaproteobacteria bacterium]|nr:UDP-N-acetylglucosamine 2-epimerase (non-hydrolyzing) [Gammaproteobacteria bacterium]